MSRLASVSGASKSGSGMGLPVRRGRPAGRRSSDRQQNDPFESRTDGPPAGAAAEAEGAPRDQMIAVFAHDLRSVLSVLTLNANLFLRREGETAEMSARNIRRAVGRMDQLISSLLDYARLRLEKLDVTPRAIDVSELIRETVELFRPVACEKSLSLMLALPDGPVRARADHIRIFQVLSNLLSNAIEASRPGGRIVVSAATTGPNVRVAVRDDGPGIPESELERVFEVFYRLPETNPRGLGLGLYICRAIIRAHGGRIWAASEAGAGSTISFTLPRSSSERPVEGPRRDSLARPWLEAARPHRSRL